MVDSDSDSDSPLRGEETPKTDSEPKERPGKTVRLLGREIVIRKRQRSPPRSRPSFRRRHIGSDTAPSNSDTGISADEDEEKKAASEDVVQRLKSVSNNSPSTQAWLTLKEKENKSSEIVDEIMAKVGIESAKEHVLQMYNEYQRTTKEGGDGCQVNLDSAFLGNPGLGQTTISRLYALLVSELTQSSKVTPVEFLAQWLSSDLYVGEAIEEIEEMGQEKGGVIIISQAHRLEKRSSALETLITLAANTPQEVVLILSGDGQDLPDLMPQTALPNSGLPRVIRLTDYTDDELHRLLTEMLSIETFEEGVQTEHFRSLARIVGSGRGWPTFRNMDALTDVVQKLRDRRRVRLERQRRGSNSEVLDSDLFTRSDMLGEEPEDMVNQSAAWKTLHSMVGLDEVKSAVKTLLAQTNDNYFLKLLDKPPLPISMSRCFLGPPGTGKTTVAKLYAEILRDLALISDQIVIKPVSDLIGEYLGHSEMRTKEALESAEGAVLIIDDVHMLLSGTGRSGGRPDIFRAAITDTLVANIQPQAASDSAKGVILIGHTDAMIELFETSNPGLARRFPLEDAFRFADFDLDQLIKIFELKLSQSGINATPAARSAAKEVLNLARHRPNFGNAGYVESLIQQAQSRFQGRSSSLDFLDRVNVVLDAEHVDPDFDRVMHATARTDKLFEKMVDMDDIKQQFKRYQELVVRLRKRGHDPRLYVPLSFIFSGPPGTGKTTVARKLGSIFYDMGLLTKPDVIECSVSDLISDHVGGTGPKVIRMFERALGKVLFVDEAYRLGEMRAADAVGEMVDCLTKERFSRKLVVILAGYREDMEKLLRFNRGMRSRFRAHVVFRPISPPQSIALLQKLVSQVDIEFVGLDRPHCVLAVLGELVLHKSWGNGRDIETLSRAVVEYAYTREGTSDATTGKVLVDANELLPILEDRLSRARLEDAQMKCNNPPSHGTTTSALTKHEDGDDRNDSDDNDHVMNSNSGDSNDIEGVFKSIADAFPKEMWSETIDQTVELIGQTSLQDSPDRLLDRGLFRLLQYHKKVGGEETDKLLADVLETADHVVDASSAGSELRAKALVLRALTKMIKAHYASLDDPTIEALVEDAMKAVHEAQSVAISLGQMWNHILRMETKRLRKMKAAISRSHTVLDEAIINSRSSLSFASTGPDGRSQELKNLILMLRSRWLRTKKPADLDEAIKHSEEYLTITSVDHASGQLLAQPSGEAPEIDAILFCDLYHLRFLRTENADDLQKILGFYRQAALEHDTDSSAVWGEPERLRNHLTLVIAGLETLDKDKELLQDANTAIRRATKSLQTTVSQGPTRDTLISELILAHKARCEATTDDRSVKEFVDLKNWLDSTISAEHGCKLNACISLVTALGHRFVVYGRAEDVELALSFSEEATNLDPRNLSVAVVFGYSVLLDLFHQKNLDRFSRAIHLLEENLPQMKENENVGNISTLSVLAALLKHKYKQSHELIDLEKRISILSRIGNANPDREDMLCQLASAYFDHFNIDKEKNLEDLDEAIRWGIKATTLPVTDAKERISSRIMLGSMYGSRFEQPTGSDADQDRAIYEYQTVFDDDDTEEIERVKAGVGLAKELGARNQWGKAAAVLTYCVGLAPQMAARLSSFEERESVLEEFSELATSCAAVIMNEADGVGGDGPAGKFTPAAAVEYLEMGRSVISGLDFQDTELEALRHRHPRLAVKFEAARQAIHALAPSLYKSLFIGIVSERHSVPEGHKRRRKEAEKHYHDVCEEVRAQEGFKHFLTHPTLNEMREAAGQGAIAIINFNELRSDAFLINQHEIKSIRLDNLSEEKVHYQLRMLKYDMKYMPFSLKWLWDAVAEPVLKALGFTGPPAPGEDWPRIWWIMTGVLTLFPLHAAGIHTPYSTDTVLDRVMSSYTNSVRWLVQSRRRARTASQQLKSDTPPVAPIHTALLVAMPITPQGQGKQVPPLPYATREVNQVEAILKRRSGFATVQLLSKNRKDCLLHLRQSSIFHFAGHGEVESGVPSRSRLLLEDWLTSPLIITDLARLRSETEAEMMVKEESGGGEQTETVLPFLAYLSACETASDRSRKLVDEGINMATGMQLAGFRHVIGAIWPVWDLHCISVAEGFYSSLPNGPIGDNDVCRALHSSIRAMRKRDYDRVLGVNVGPKKDDRQAQREVESDASSQNQEVDLTLGETTGEDSELDTDYVFSEAEELKAHLKRVTAEGTVNVENGAPRLTYMFEMGNDDESDVDDSGSNEESSADEKAKANNLPFPIGDWYFWIKPVYWASYVHYGV